MSVPHSGTRSLVRLLELGPLPGGRLWWHFGTHDAELRQYRGPVHIPLRHPIAVAASWARRPKTGDALRAMLCAYEALFEYLEAEPEDCTLHVMEGLPRADGTADYPGVTAAPAAERRYITAVLEAVVTPHEAFWRRYYGEDAWRSTPTKR